MVATIGDRNILCAFIKTFRYILEILDMDSDKRSFEMYINWKINYRMFANYRRRKNGICTSTLR